MDDINFAIKNSYQDTVSCIYSDYNNDNLVFRIRVNKIIQSKKSVKQYPLDQSDEIYLLTNFQNQLLDNVILRGIKNIDKVLLRKNPQYMNYEDGQFVPKDMWVLDTVGTNLLEILGLDYIDRINTSSNSIMEVYHILGIEAARQTIYNELEEAFGENGYINTHHLSMLADRMTYAFKPISIFRHGINNDNIGPIAKAAFEETPEMFLRAARHAELDNMRGVSANIMCGQEGFFGTGMFETLLDINEMKKLQAQQLDVESSQSKIDTLFESVDNPQDPCSNTNLLINNNTVNIEKEQLGEDDDDYDIDL